MRYRAIPEYYDYEYCSQDMLQRDVPFLLEHMPRRQSVLELAVGTARAAIPIAQAGHRVVGIDNDPKMLAIAQRKRDFAALRERQLLLKRADILDLDLGSKFDWICLLFNTFMVFTTPAEQERALAAIRKHLRPRGRFWLDIFQPNLPLLSRPRTIGLDPVLFYVPESGRTVYKNMEVRPDPTRQVQRIIYHYIWFDENGHEKRQDTAFDLTVIFPRELEMLLHRKGFRIEHLYGDYDGSQLNVNSPRMIACCRQG
jgi:SAM-dependent methyltransferase